jgi:hypothetical protein
VDWFLVFGKRKYRRGTPSHLGQWLGLSRGKCCTAQLTIFQGRERNRAIITDISHERGGDKNYVMDTPQKVQREI